LRIDVDCDRDALRFRVRQQGAGFCHKGTRTCFGQERGLVALLETLARRAVSAPEGSYTKRLLDEPGLLGAKLREEAAELAEAAPEQVAHEAADLIYFAAVAMSRAGVTLEQVERELDLRSLRVTRRSGDAKPAGAEEGGR
jgi:phosphoribosyl-ATP pyrophosphohydrolase/phosphoribosyl-AMP cyclohydrolase/histidinol dehydrogenase